jgi:hypothetical protein
VSIFSFKRTTVFIVHSVFRKKHPFDGKIPVSIQNVPGKGEENSKSKEYWL